MRFELKSPVKTIEDFIKRFTPSRLTSGSNSSSSSSLVTNRSSNRGCSSMLSSPSAESTLTKLDEERPPAGLEHAFSPVPPCYDGKAWNPEEGELRYEAESPDEAALVYAARAYKCSLVGRLPDQVTVELPHLGKLNFELLHTLGFDSTRKRMSVVVRHPLTDQIIVYTKGADSVIMDLIKPPDTGEETLTPLCFHTVTVRHLFSFLSRHEETIYFHTSDLKLSGTSAVVLRHRLSSKDDGHTCADGNCGSHFPLLCFAVAGKKKQHVLKDLQYHLKLNIIDL